MGDIVAGMDTTKSERTSKLKQKKTDRDSSTTYVPLIKQNAAIAEMQSAGV
jgi:hypothetical protein